MSNIIPFNYEGVELRAVTMDGQPWFLATDVCEILEHTNPSMAVSRLDEDEKLTSVMFISGQNREVLFVNEPGLYSLILTSRKPEAKTFKRWITHEVIPSIRKTGSYQAPVLSEKEAIAMMFRTTADLLEETTEIKSKVKSLETKLDNQMTIDHIGQRRIQRAVAAKVYVVATDPNNPRERTSLFRELYREIKDRWGVASYRDLKTKDIDAALAYINAWVPRRASA